MDERPSLERARWLDLGWLIAGAIVLAVGVYYLVRNLFGISLPELDWDAIWPLAVIAIGLGIVWRTWFVYQHPAAKG